MSSQVPRVGPPQKDGFATDHCVAQDGRMSSLGWLIVWQLGLNRVFVSQTAGRVPGRSRWWRLCGGFDALHLLVGQLSIIGWY